MIMIMTTAMTLTTKIREQGPWLDRFLLPSPRPAPPRFSFLFFWSQLLTSLFSPFPLPPTPTSTCIQKRSVSEYGCIFLLLIISFDRLLDRSIGWLIGLFITLLLLLLLFLLTTTMMIRLSIPPLAQPNSTQLSSTDSTQLCGAQAREILICRIRCFAYIYPISSHPILSYPI